MSVTKLTLFKVLKRGFLIVVFFSWVLILIAFSPTTKNAASEECSSEDVHLNEATNVKHERGPIELNKEDTEKIKIRMARDSEMIKKICSKDSIISKTSATFLKKHPRVAVDHYFMDNDKNMGYCINAKVCNKFSL